MKPLIPSQGMILFLAVLLLLGGVFAWTVKADSTITIPVPEELKNNNFTLSLKIPPKTEPLTQKVPKPTLKSRRSLIVWDANPSPKLQPHDEFYPIVENFNKKGWIKTFTARELANIRPLDRCFAVRLIQYMSDAVLEVLQSPSVTRTIKRSNLTASDIEDLRRMIKRFSVDLVRFGANPVRLDKDLLVLQDRIKKSRQGVLKVIKVEGVEDGGTVIHLSVD